MSNRVLLENVRLSYANVWEPRSIQGSEPKYSTSILIPKTGEYASLLEDINHKIEEAIADGLPKWGGKRPANLKLPLRDGDMERPDDPVYAGHMFLNANSTMAPQIVNRQVQPITDQQEVYSGCWVNITINFYAFAVSGNRGIACGLGNIQKVRDDEHLGGMVSAASDFTALDGGGEFNLLD